MDVSCAMESSEGGGDCIMGGNAAAGGGSPPATIRCRDAKLDLVPVLVLLLLLALLLVRVWLGMRVLGGESANKGPAAVAKHEGRPTPRGLRRAWSPRFRPIRPILQRPARAHRPVPFPKHRSPTHRQIVDTAGAHAPCTRPARRPPHGKDPGRERRLRTRASRGAR
eukprot:scaffold343895_cov50-Attheya_sp.AAC.1